MSVEIVRIDTDELYPCHIIVNPYEWGTDCEVPTETAQRWNRIAREFYIMQKEMGDALNRNEANP